MLPAGPLSDPLPLRDTTVWPHSGPQTLLPIVVGQATVTAIPYPAVARRYVLADHALAGVDAVYDDGVAIAGWRHVNGVDLTDHAVAFLDLATTPAGAVTADVRGLSGNPGDLLAWLAPTADLRELTARMRYAGIALGGQLRQAMTRRAAIQWIVDQFGGAWSAGMPGFASEFPPPETDPLWATFGPLERGDTQAQCTLETLWTRLIVSFDAGADDALRQAVRLVAASTATYGDRTTTLTLPWVKTRREAATIGARWLQWRARPLWTVQFVAGPLGQAIPPGAWIALSGADVPITGPAVVLDADPDWGGGQATLTVQAPAGAAPTIQVEQVAAV